MTAFYADLRLPGVTRKPLETMGAHCSPLGELTFENFRLPVSIVSAMKETALRSACGS